MGVLTKGSRDIKERILTTGDEASEHLLFILILLPAAAICEIRPRRRRRTFRSFHLSPRYAAFLPTLGALYQMSGLYERMAKIGSFYLDCFLYINTQLVPKRSVLLLSRNNYRPSSPLM